MRRSTLLPVLLFSCACSFARPAEAREGVPPAPFTIGPKPAWYLMGGATTGGTLVARDRGFYVGGELSLLRLLEGRFLGVYGDGYYDFGIDRTYATTGVELGYKLVGIDGGVATRLGGERVEIGVASRLFVTFGVLSVYARYAFFPEPLQAENMHAVQIGGLLKLPFAEW
jgi:hypothetical protein